MSVRPSNRPSVGPSVGRSVTHELKSRIWPILSSLESIKADKLSATFVRWNEFTLNNSEQDMLWLCYKSIDICFSIDLSFWTCLSITFIDSKQKMSVLKASFSAQKVGEKSINSPRVEAFLISRLQRLANICDRGWKKRSSGFCPIKIERHEHGLHRQHLKHPHCWNLQIRRWSFY